MISLNMVNMNDDVFMLKPNGWIKGLLSYIKKE